MIERMLDYNIDLETAKIIADRTGMSIDDIMYNSEQTRYNALKDKKLTKQQRKDLEKRVKRFEDDVNRKIEREVRKRSGNPDELKMLFREVKRGLSNAEKYSENSYVMDVPERIIDDLVDGKASAEMKLINKNFSHNEEELIRRMKIKIDFSKIQTMQDYSLVAISLNRVRNRSSLVTAEIANNVYTTRKEKNKLTKLIELATKNKKAYQDALVKSEVEGHPDIFFTEGEINFSLDGVHDYRSYLNRVNQIMKYADPNYYKNRANIYKQNYLKAVYDELPLDQAMKIEEIVNNSDWVDFMKLAEVHPAARIDYMYASGSRQGEIIIKILENNLT